MPVGSAAPIGYVLQGAGGLRAELCSHGALRRLDCDSIILNLFLGNELEGGPANVYLRAGGAVTALLGPASKTRCLASSTSEWLGAGSWGDINYSIALMLAGASPAWFLHVLLNNAGSAAVTLE